MDEVEKRFWICAGQRGYPADPSEIIYGSREHEIYLELRRFLEIDRAYLEGKHIGFPGGMFLQNLWHRYPDLHICLSFLVQGDEGAVKEATKGIEEEVMWYTSNLRHVRRDIEDVVSWLKAGGRVEPRAAIQIIREEIFHHTRGDEIDALLSEDAEREKVKEFKEMGVSARGIEMLRRRLSEMRRAVGDERSGVERALERLKEELKNTVGLSEELQEWRIF